MSGNSLVGAVTDDDDRAVSYREIKGAAKAADVLLKFNLLASRQSRAEQLLNEKVYYGNPVAAHSNIANGQMIDPVAFRFKAIQSAAITSFHQWWRWTSPHNGYSKGDGGLYRIELQGDNDGVPDGVVQGIAAIYDPDVTAHPSTGVSSINMDGGSTVAGMYYNVVLTNIHSDPANNFVSFNGAHYPQQPMNFNDSRPCQPDLITLYFHSLNGGAQAWMPYPNDSDPSTVYMNSWTVGYDNGKFDGEEVQYGHMQTTQPIVSGVNKVRTIYDFEDTGPTSRFYFFAKLEGGDDPLTVTIGGLAQQIRVLNTEFAWLSVPYTAGVSASSTLEVVFSTPATSTYTIGGVQRAQWRQTRRYLGMAEKTSDDGATWANWGHVWQVISAYFS